jgi:hypothetical protein
MVVGAEVDEDAEVVDSVLDVVVVVMAVDPNRCSKKLIKLCQKDPNIEKL